ncbi:gastrula zinc finger protein XlCGF26.1-like [Vespula pensylvanica]|nr:gastrula zinc finger protein XlCGF26.1-like [Vespula pensylvanica]
MLRQILSPSPSPETGEAGMTAIGCNFLQANSIFSNQSSMMPSTLSSATLQTIPSHLSMIYPDQGGLLMDQSQLVLPESHPCPTCGLEFRSALKLNYHVKTSHPRPPEYEQQNVEITARYSCSVCPRSFFVLAHLRMHETTHEIAPHSSSVLGASSSNVPTSRGANSATGLMSGMSVVVPAGAAATGNVEKTFGCDRCPASFRYRTLLERHRRMHELGQEKPYSCPRCLMRFETRNLYNHHAKTHKPSIDINDRLAADSNAVSLTDPTLTVTGTNPSVVGCPPSTTVVAANANKSLTTASYPCDSCSKQFATIESLTSHKAVHRSRPLVCDVCGKGFTHRKYYVVHQRIHTGERPYLCAMCGKSFTQASTLTVHRRYHTGERPYTCTLCGKGFVTRTIMLNHMKKH